MKNIVLLIFFFAFSNVVFSQYTVDFGKAPLNTVPEKYTANLMQYKGNPKKVTKISYGDTFIYHFNKQGKLTSIESPYYVNPSEYFYNDKGYLEKVTYPYPKITEINLYKTNDKGFLLEDNFTAYNQKVLFEYNDKGLLCKHTGTDGTVTNYEYDIEGRVVKELGENYENTFVYSQDRGYVKVTKFSKSTDYENAHNYYFNSQGINIGNDKPGDPLELPQLFVESDSIGNVTKISTGYGTIREQSTFEYY